MSKVLEYQGDAKCLRVGSIDNVSLDRQVQERLLTSSVNLSSQLSDMVQEVVLLSASRGQRQLSLVAEWLESQIEILEHYTAMLSECSDTPASSKPQKD